MGSVLVFDTERMQEIEDTTVVSGLVDVDGHLILYQRDGSTMDAGNVKGDTGPAGVLPSFVIAYKNAASVPSTYAIGISVMNVGAIDDWPISLMTVITTRWGATRTVQEGFHKQSGKNWVRTEMDIDAWGPWVESLGPSTNAETITGTATDKAVTPASLQALTASESRKGILDLADAAEVAGRASNTKAVSPLRLINHPGIAWARAEGKVAVAAVAVSASLDVTITFPTSRFSVAPSVMLTSYTTRLTWQITEGSVTATGFTARCTNWSGGAGAATFLGWSATQMTSAAGVG